MSTQFALKVAELILNRIDFERARKLLRPLFWVGLISSFLLAGFLSFLLWSQFGQAENLMAVTLSSKLEETPEQYKALSALVLSGFDESFNQSDISPDTRNFFASLSLVSSSSSNEKKVLNAIAVREKLGTHFLTMSSTHAFVTLPAKHLKQDEGVYKRTDVAYSALTPETKAMLGYVQNIDAAGLLCSLNGKNALSVQPSLVAQTYIISGADAAALCKSGETNSENHFLKYFHAERSFSDRPYYKATLKDLPSRSHSEKTSQYFHITPYYIDTAGGGFIKTFCRDLTIPPSNQSNAMLCLDILLSDETAQSIISEKMSVLGGDVMRAICTAQGCEPKALKTEEWGFLNEWLHPVRSNLVSVIHDVLGSNYKDQLSKGTLEEVAGRIYVQEENTSPTDEDGKASTPNNYSPLLVRSRHSDVLSFALPISEEGNQTEFLVCQIRLNSLGHQRLLAGIVASMAFVVGLCLLFGTIYRYAVRLREQAKTLGVLQRLMKDFPVPYCHCDEKDRIIEFNGAFARLLGFRQTEVAKKTLLNKSFSELLDDELSVAIYIKARRERELKPGIPYEVTISREQGIPVNVVIYGAPVPNPISSEDRNPQTFGLFLKTEIHEIIKA